jgi:hypothetical protein
MRLVSMEENAQMQMRIARPYLPHDHIPVNARGVGSAAAAFRDLFTPADGGCSSSRVTSFLLQRARPALLRPG